MIIAWHSEKHNEIIPYERVICVKAGMSTGQLVVRLEGDNCVTVMPDEVADFIDGFKTWAAIVEIQSLEIVPSDLPTKKGEFKNES